MERPLDICVDAYVSGERFDPASLPQPVDVRKATHDELALAWQKQWQPGQEIRVRFLDGDRSVHDRVEACARRWLEHANLDFAFGRHADAEIRITFEGNGYKSLVGKDALRAPDPVPTMQLGGLTAESDEHSMRRTVLHEFGHAIGCIHEQASPTVEIPWDEKRVYEYYRRWQGWDDETIYHNVLSRYSRAETRFTDHDPASIMQYPVPNDLTIGDFEIGWNNDLSEVDKSFVARMYPR